MNIDDQRDRQRIKQLEVTCSQHVNEINRLEFKIGELSSEISHLHAELKQHRGTRQNAHALYRAIDDAIIHQIDKRGYAFKKPVLRRANFSIDAKSFVALPKGELMTLAANYDARAYFRYHSPRTTMRFRYRLVSKAYRTLRDAAVLSLKRGYRLARRLSK